MFFFCVVNLGMSLSAVWRFAVDMQQRIPFSGAVEIKTLCDVYASSAILIAW
jgi:hypothetical protein